MNKTIQIYGLVRKVGNSHAFFIPKHVVDSSGIEEGDYLHGVAEVLTKEEYELQQELGKYKHHGKGSFKDNSKEGAIREIHFNELKSWSRMNDGPETEQLGAYGLVRLSLNPDSFIRFCEFPRLDSDITWEEVPITLSGPSGEVNVILTNFRLRNSTFAQANKKGLVEFSATVKRWGDKEYVD